MLFSLGLDISFTLILLAQVLALVLDQLLGEPRRYHPLVGFGALLSFLQSNLNKEGQHKKAKGVLAWLLAVVPLVSLCAGILWLSAQFSTLLFWVLSTLILYLSIGLNSLKRHANWVAEPLAKGDLSGARQKLSWLVSRQTEKMDETQINKACIESVLENGSDAVYGALFWFIVAGAPGALMYRLANTLDASWGYRTPRYLDFGYAAARLDDLLNLIPARVCSLAYSLSGDCRNAFASWRSVRQWRQTDGLKTASPNAGIVMASGAGALCLRLGGLAVYEGVERLKPQWGRGELPQVQDIGRSIHLLYRSLLLFVLVQALLIIPLIRFLSVAAGTVL